MNNYLKPWFLPILSGIFIGTSYIPFPPWASLFCFVPLWLFWSQQTSLKRVVLGGFITAFLTLAIIASTMTTGGSMARNVSLISMLYTGTAVVGPLIAGAAMKALHADALMWFTAATAFAMACGLAGVASRRLQPAVATNG